MNTKKIKNSLNKILTIAGISALALATQLPMIDVKAAGITPTVTPSTSAVSTSGSISLAFTTSANIAIGSTIQVTYNSGYTGTLSTSNVTINGVAPSSVVNAASGSEISSTFTVNSAITSGSTVTIALGGLTSPISAGNYAFGVTTSVGDYGANFQYVGQANVVQIRAVVPVSLGFAIRNTGDTANTNICDLGVASTTAVSTCGYRLKVTTNANNGYTVSVQTSGNLTNGTANISNAAAGATGTNIVSGTEMYGARITGGSATGGTVNVATTYNAGATNSVNYANTGVQTLLTSTGPNSPLTSGDTTNTTLVTHNLGIGSNTPAGLYTQTVTYTVTPSF